MQVKIKRLRQEAIMPQYQTKGSAAFDLHSTVDVTIKSGEWLMVPTGLSFEIPFGYVGYVHARSGLAAKNGISMVNGTGVVDSDYRGEVQGIVMNSGKSGFSIKVGDRIAQMVIIKLPKITLVEATELNETERGTGGFGSTGVGT
jgi:dUTP pyrophosphatase